MTAFLDQIVAATRQRVAEAKHSVDMGELERRAEEHVPRGFRRALEIPHPPAKTREGWGTLASANC